MAPLDQVRNVEDVAQARALHSRFLAELTKPGLPAHRAYELDIAIDSLEGDYPELQESSIEQAEKRQGQNVKRRTKAHPGRRRASSGGSAGRSVLARRSRGGSGRAGRTFRRTGLPAAATRTTDVVLQFIGATLGITLLYLFIGNRRGASGLDAIVSGTAGAFRRFIDPVDPLAPRPSVNAQARAAERAGATAARFQATHAPTAAIVRRAFHRHDLSQLQWPRTNVGSRVGVG